MLISLIVFRFFCKSHFTDKINALFIREHKIKLELWVLVDLPPNNTVMINEYYGQLLVFSFHLDL